MSKKDFEENKEKDDSFIEDFEDWHSRKYSDEYRFRNKTPFFIKSPNHLILGILLICVPLLSLIVTIILDFGMSFYLFFIMLCFP
ncbi:MAG: hypothetical protein MUW56_09420 [Chryseobacterium sp.]|uniref:hypothetical protein n=1 Tax=Chryseobacterium sp. TaxID=1871047 RepID=UPI0025B9CC30|nr:hypothetical protein [Chryseobacterium sp.]MCJ7933836.1 hypothetical protein [Chryseobacterium sp.]